jgi:hypothetical protein
MIAAAAMPPPHSADHLQDHESTAALSILSNMSADGG